MANARWDWQVSLDIQEQKGPLRSLSLKCRGGFFEEEYIELGKPYLWVFDYRRGGTQGEDKEWCNEDYNIVFNQLKKRMTAIVRWNAVFLFPPGIYFDESMRTKMTLPEGCTYLRGT